MKYTFANYPTGKHILKVGNDTLVVTNGVAEVNELDPIQVTLAEVYGGKPVASDRPKHRRPVQSSLKVVDRSLARLIQKRKRALIATMRALGAARNGRAQLGSGSE